MAEVEKLAHALARGSTFERVLRVVPITTPAAGADLSIVVPGGSVWIPRALTATLTTSAAVANRSTMVQLTDGTAVLFTLPTGLAHAASLAARYSWVNGNDFLVGSVAGGNITSDLPDMALPAGYTITTVTTLVDVADQWSKAFLWVEEILSMPQGVHEVNEAGVQARLIGTSLAAEAGT